MSRRTTKQRRAARRRRLLFRLAKSLMSGITAPARQWFHLTDPENDRGSCVP